MAAKKSCNAVCLKDERKKEDPLSTEIQRQCEGKTTPSTLRMLFIDFAAQVLYTALAWHKSPHQPTSLFHEVTLPIQFLWSFLKTSNLPLPLQARKMTMRFRRPLQRTLKKKIRSYATQLKKVKKTRKPKCFPCSCACKKLNQSKKSTEIWGRVIGGGRIKREDKLRRPRMRDPGEVQPGQLVTEYKRSDSLELCLQRSAFLEMANQEKTDSHTNIGNWWLQLKIKQWKDDICVCVNFLMEGRERREEVGTWKGMDMGSREVGEQTLRFPVSQKVEVWTESGVCTEDG